MKVLLNAYAIPLKVNCISSDCQYKHDTNIHTAGIIIVEPLEGGGTDIFTLNTTNLASAGAKSLAKTGTKSSTPSIHHCKALKWTAIVVFTYQARLTKQKLSASEDDRTGSSLL